MSVSQGKPRPGYLFVLPFLPPNAIGGVAQVFIHLVDHMNRTGSYTPYLLVCNGPADPRNTAHLHCPVFSMPVREPTSKKHPFRAPIAFWLTLPWVLWKLRSIIKERDIRRIHFHFPDEGRLTFALLRALRLFSGKVIFHLHGTDIKLASDNTGAARSLARLSFRLADCVVACSRGIRDDLLRFEPRCERNSVVIHNAIDMQEFTSQVPPDFELPESLRNRPYLLTVGRYQYFKAQDVLIHAFEQLTARFPDVLLLMIGETGAEVEDIRRMVRESPAASRIVMLENVPHHCVPGFLQASLLFVLSSRREGFPVVILEAAACRKAVVATACLGVPELIQDGVTGRIVPVDDPGALTAAIADLLENTPLRQTFADNLNRHVSENLTWNATFPKYMNL